MKDNPDVAEKLSIFSRSAFVINPSLTKSSGIDIFCFVSIKCSIDLSAATASLPDAADKLILNSKASHYTIPAIFGLLNAHKGMIVI